MIDRKKCKQYLQDFCATYDEVEDVVDALRSLNAEEEITDEEYDYIMENYDELANEEEGDSGMAREEIIKKLEKISEELDALQETDLLQMEDGDDENTAMWNISEAMGCIGNAIDYLDNKEDEEDEEYTIFDTLQEAEEYLENLAAEDGCWSYEIVEDNYEIPNGLLLIEYLDKDREHEDRHYLVGYKHECPKDDVIRRPGDIDDEEELEDYAHKYLEEEYNHKVKSFWIEFDARKIYINDIKWED